MTKNEFKILVFESKNGNNNNAFEKNKMNEICEALNKDECDLIAIEIATNFDKSTISLKNFVDFVKNALIANAYFLAEKTELLNSKYISRFEEKKALQAFYYKRALKRMPKWAQKAILGSSDE